MVSPLVHSPVGALGWGVALHHRSKLTAATKSKHTAPTPGAPAVAVEARQWLELAALVAPAVQALLAGNLHRVGANMLGAGLLELEVILHLHVGHVQLTDLQPARVHVGFSN